MAAIAQFHGGIAENSQLKIINDFYVNAYIMKKTV